MLSVYSFGRPGSVTRMILENGVLLDWDIDCCIGTNGGRVFEPSRDEQLCEGVANFGSYANDLVNVVDAGSQWDWTSFEDELIVSQMVVFGMAQRLELMVTANMI